MSISFDAGRTKPVDRTDWMLAVPVELVLWAGLLIAALALRLGAIDATPLAPDEVGRALDGLARWRGLPIDERQSPLLPNLLSLWFALFTPADGPARVPSALVGTALCLTPLLFRPWLGWRGTLAAGLLLAVSPLGILASRSVHPATFEMFAGVVLVGSVLRAIEQAEQRWLLVSAAAVALGLAAAPTFVNQIVAVSLAAALVPPVMPRAGLAFGRVAPRAAVIGLGASVLLSTRLLTIPAGLQAGLVDPLSSWLRTLGLSAATIWSGGLVALVEVVLLAIAAASLPRAARSPFGRFLGAWAGTSALVALTTRTPELSLFGSALVPLALLAGLGVSEGCWRLPVGRGPTAVTALALLVPPLFFALATAGSAARGSPGFASLAVALGGTAAILLIASTWLDRRALLGAVILALAVMLGALHLNGLTRLNYAGYERGGPLFAQATGRPGLREVEAQMHDWWRQDPSAPVYIDASLRPVLGWAVRDAPRVRWVTSVPATTNRVVLNADTATERPPLEWIRVEAGVRYQAPGEINPGQAWRWLASRQPLGRSEPYAILLPR